VEAANTAIGALCFRTVGILLIIGKRIGILVEAIRLIRLSDIDVSNDILVTAEEGNQGLLSTNSSSPICGGSLDSLPVYLN
jgi:hypothetical protein